MIYTYYFYFKKIEILFFTNRPSLNFLSNEKWCEKALNLFAVFRRLDPFLAWVQNLGTNWLNPISKTMKIRVIWVTCQTFKVKLKAVTCFRKPFHHRYLTGLMPMLHISDYNLLQKIKKDLKLLPIYWPCDHILKP